MSDAPKECLYAGLICCYSTLRSPADMLIGCHAKQECLCGLYESCCVRDWACVRCNSIVSHSFPRQEASCSAHRMHNAA